MTWERFGYICRKANDSLQSNESVSECIRRIEKDPGCKFYGSDLLSNGLPRKLLKEMGSIYERDKAKESLKIYSEIRLSEHLSEPMQFKRVFIYLAYVTFIFFMVSAIYQLKVAPTFLEVFDNLEVSIPSHLLFYRDYWKYFVIFIFSILAFGLVAGNTLRDLFSFRRGSESGLILRYFSYRGIRRSYSNILGMLSFPISDDSLLLSTDKESISTHLNSIKNSGMNISVEMQEMIKNEMNTLIDLCEKQMRVISVGVAVVVVSAIFFFMVSAYSPIFMLGDAI